MSSWYTGPCRKILDRVLGTVPRCLSLRVSTGLVSVFVPTMKCNICYCLHRLLLARVKNRLHDVRQREVSQLDFRKIVL